MAKTELTCMVMVLDSINNKVLVQDRIKDWKGINFPGGHVEEGESLVDAAIREVKEETGLSVSDLKPCGIVHWYNNKTGDRYIVFNFRTSSFSGNLIVETAEGKVFWVEVDKLSSLNLAEGFIDRLPMFLDDLYVEGFQIWNEEERYITPMKWI